jgi:hypothetical protein
MKIFPVSTAVLICALHFIGTQDSFAQGSLTPPGAPGPTMKTLQQVEPRVDVATLDNTGDTNSAYVISQPGSYYLSGNLTIPSGKNGIHILATNVTLDLRGFALIGNNNTQTAIVASGNNVIRNGQLLLWETGVSLNFFGDSCVVEELLVIGGLAGVTGSSGSNPNLIVRRCEIYVFGNAIVSFGEVTDCYVNGAAAGFAGAGRFTRCTAVGGTRGFILGGDSTLIDCTATGGAQGFNLPANCHLTHCAASKVTSAGFVFDSQCSFDHCAFSVASGSTGVNGFYGTLDGTNYSQNCVFRACSALGGGGTGSGMTLFAAGAGSTFENCNATGGSTGFFVTGNNSDANGSSTSFTNCTATANNAQGFNVGAGCVFNTCSAGINGTFNFTTGDGCTLIGCSALGRSTQTGTPVGFHVGSACIVTSCSASTLRGDGFQFGSGCFLSGNLSRSNGVSGVIAHGFHGIGTANRIDGNFATNNTGTGILSSASTVDYTTRNTSIGNATNYNPSSGPVMAPVSAPGVSTNPWSNF